MVDFGLPGGPQGGQKQEKTVLRRGVFFHHFFDDFRWGCGHLKPGTAAGAPPPIRHQMLSLAKSFLVFVSRNGPDALSKRARPDLMGCALCRRPLTIARCSEILDFGHFWICILLVLVPKPIVWQACGLHFGILGGPGTIQEHLGAQERRPWGPGLDFYRFGADLGTPFSKLFRSLGSK